MTAADKRREMLAVVETTAAAFGEPRSVSILREASDAGIEDIWDRHFALWWARKQNDEPTSPATGQ